MYCSRSSVVVITIRPRGEQSWVRIQVDRRDFFLFQNAPTALEPTQTVFQSAREFFPGIKRPGRKVRYARISSAQVKNN